MAPCPVPPGPGTDVARALAELKTAVRQRRSELATVGGAATEARLRLAELRRLEYVREPTPVSPRPFFGPLLVLARKAAYHLFFKWHARGVVEQQNALNQATGRLLEELIAGLEGQARELALLGRRCEALEERLAGLEGKPPAPRSRSRGASAP